MKKIAFILIALSVIGSGSILKAQKFSFGIQSGLNFSDKQVINKKDFTDDNKVYSPLLLLNANFTLGFKSKSFWGLTVEPGYIQKGGLRSDVTIQTGDILYMPQDFKYIADYIQMPVLIDLYFTKNIYLSAGPEFAYLIKARAKSTDFSFDISDNYKQLEISGDIGINYNLSENVYVGVLYSHSLSSSSKLFWKDDFGVITGISKEYNQYLLFRIGFKI
jgi:hypothetical protein